MSIVFSDNILETDPNENAINLTTANLDVIINPNVHITATGTNSIGIASTASGQTLTISSGTKVSGAAQGLNFAGNNNSVHNAGKITGAASVFLGGPVTTGNQLVNDGEITTSDVRAIIMGDGSFMNRGTVNGLVDLQSVLNTNGTRGIIENSGTMTQGSTGNPDRYCISVSGAYLSADVRNTGLIDGNIKLGSTTLYGDIYDGRNGRITGFVDLNGGDDRAYGNAKYDETFLGGQGNDTIDGGGGNDVALYSNSRASYEIVTINGVTTVVGRVGKDAGTDMLTNVRFLKFTDKTVMLYNTKPDSIALKQSAFAEDMRANTVITTLSAHDADGDALTYTLNDPSGTFRIDGNALVLLKSLDYETRTSYAVTVEAKDAYGLATSQTLTLTVNNILETTARTLTGTAGADSLTGENGNDLISGLAGRDALNGLGGKDRINGGAGRDMLTGGGDQDIFVFDAKLAKTNTANKRYNLDRITDFSVKDDTIHLKKSVFKGITKKGVLSKGAFYASTKSAAHDADDRIIYNKKTGALLYDRDGSDHHYGAIQIATLSTKLGLKNTDFFVI
jgi:Ca2+-binding RTX toxin-like protein